MPTTTLTEAAASLLCRRLAGETIEVDDENRILYRELADAGLMEPRHSFSRGDDGFYRVTEAGVRMRDAMLGGRANPPPSA